MPLIVRTTGCVTRSENQCDSLQTCSTVNESKVYIPAEGRIECIRVVSLPIATVTQLPASVTLCDLALYKRASMTVVTVIVTPAVTAP